MVVFLFMAVFTILFIGLFMCLLSVFIFDAMLRFWIVQTQILNRIENRIVKMQIEHNKNYQILNTMYMEREIKRNI